MARCKDKSLAALVLAAPPLPRLAREWSGAFRLEVDAHRAHAASPAVDVQEQATCDMVAEGVSDMRGGLLGFPFNAPDAARQQSAGLLNRYAPVFVHLLQTGGPYVAGGASMTYADVLLAGECARCAV